MRSGREGETGNKGWETSIRERKREQEREKEGEVERRRGEVYRQLQLLHQCLQNNVKL